MGLKEIFAKGLDKTDPIPGSNLGRRVRQLDQAPARIMEWVDAELEKERQIFRKHKTPKAEREIFSSEEIAEESLKDFPFFGRIKNKSSKNPNQE